MKHPVAIVALLTALSAPLSPVSAQTHVYNLNNSLADLYAGPSLVAHGGTLGANGYSFLANQGLSLSNVFASGASYSLAIQSSYATQAGWQKMIDFIDRATDQGYYTNGTQASFYPAAQGSPGAYSANQLAMTVVTRDAATAFVSVYVDGAPQLSFIDNAGVANPNAANGIVWFFMDDYATSLREAGAGYVDYIAIYDRALTDTEVQNLVPVTATPEPASMMLLATGLAGVLAATRRRRAF